MQYRNEDKERKSEETDEPDHSGKKPGCQEHIMRMWHRPFEIEWERRLQGEILFLEAPHPYPHYRVLGYQAERCAPYHRSGSERCPDFSARKGLPIKRKNDKSEGRDNGEAKERNRSPDGERLKKGNGEENGCRRDERDHTAERFGHYECPDDDRESENHHE